jgi:hypothetical protein
MRECLVLCGLFMMGVIVGKASHEQKMKENPITFFGATIDGPIIPQFDGRMECAWVKYADTRKCRCHTNKYGWGWDSDKTFMISPNPKRCEEIIK